MIPAWILASLVGCGGEIVVTPDVLDFGEVDFQTELPPEGYEPIQVQIDNVGGRALTVRIVGLDDGHLVLGGFFPNGPGVLDEIDGGEVGQFAVGARAYEEGERDTLVEGSFRLEADGLRDPVEIPWSFTPIRDI